MLIPYIPKNNFILIWHLIDTFGCVQNFWLLIIFHQDFRALFYFHISKPASVSAPLAGSPPTQIALCTLSCNCLHCHPSHRQMFSSFLTGADTPAWPTGQKHSFTSSGSHTSPWTTCSFSLTPVRMPSSPSQIPKPISEPPQPSPNPARMGTSFVLSFLKALAWNYLERERKRKSEIMEWNFNIFHIILGDKFFKESFRNKVTFKLYVSGIDFFTGQILLFRSWIQRSSPKNIQANWRKVLQWVVPAMPEGRELDFKVKQPQNRLLTRRPSCELSTRFCMGCR